jgi:sugar phosphate isomerase/epimerase
MAIELGLNFDFIRSADKSFAVAVERAAELGYRYVEPFVHTGRELMSEAGYYHSFSMEQDPLVMKETLDRHGVRASALSAHCSLMRPEISVPYLERAIRFAAAVGAPIVNTDEGARPSWMSDQEAFQMMGYTLGVVLGTAKRYGVYLGIEPHQSLTRTTQGLIRIATLVESPLLRVNYDTGNAYLAGENPYEGLRAVGKLLVHIHAKDISIQHSEAERGKVTGTPVGCACGDGVLNWEEILNILREVDYDGVLSVECGTEEQAARSLTHLQALISESTVSRASTN